MSILPNKYVPVDYAIIGVASSLLSQLGSNDTVSSLWDRVCRQPQVRTFDRYAEALTLLFAANFIVLRQGIITPLSEGSASK
jgi:hypothetical protein